MPARVSEPVAAQRAAETVPCKRCGGPARVWSRDARGRWHKRHKAKYDGPFCCRSCAIEYRHENDAFHGRTRTVTPKEIARRLVAGERLANWHRSEQGRAFHRAQAGRQKRRIIQPHEQIAAASIASQVVVSLANGAGHDMEPPELSISIDARLLVDRSGSANPRAQSIVRLADEKVYEYARLAASEIGGTDSGISEAIGTGSYHRGYQFMLFAAWIAAGQPTRHPLNTADLPVEKPPRDELEEGLKNRSYDQAGELYGVSGATVWIWAHSYGLVVPDKRKKEKPSPPEIDVFMREHTWGEAEKHFGLTHKTLRKVLIPGGFDPKAYETRQRMTGAKNAYSQRVVRLSDGKVFESGREAARAVGGHDQGISTAVHKGRLHRGEQWMAEDEWIAGGRPDKHPLRARK